SYTYQAEFLPEFVANDKGEPLARGLAGDRPQNNRATTHVVARGQRRVLVIEPKKGDHAFLVKQLEAAGTSKFQVEAKQVEDLPQEKGALGAMLSESDSIVLANVPASDIAEGLNVGGDNLSGVITEAQQEVLRSSTHDQGCGLVMIGGPNAFGAGGWQGTPVEKALPVGCEIKALEVTGKGGLVMSMHASELAKGNYWQKGIAKLGITKLGTQDEGRGRRPLLRLSERCQVAHPDAGDRRKAAGAAGHGGQAHPRRHARLRPGAQDGLRRADRGEARPDDQAHHPHQRRRPRPERQEH